MKSLRLSLIFAFALSWETTSCITARNCKQISTSTGLTMGLECTMQVLVGGMWWIR
jgi:hypothetical protein